MTLSAHRSLTYRNAQLLLVAVFILSRSIYFAAGVRLNVVPIDQFWQMADPLLLKNDLVRSLWYMHMQPPGYNLVIGLLLKLFPTAYGVALWVLHLALGVLIALALLRLMCWMNVALPWAFALTAFFVVSPATLLYENAATYEYPICGLLLFGTIALARFCEHPRALNSLMFFGSLATLALIRNLFHIYYLILVATGVLLLFPRARKAVLLGALAPLLVVGGMYVKNAILFQHFTSSTFDGMLQGRSTTDQLTHSEAASLIGAGVVSPFAAIPTFSPLSVYLPYLDSLPAKTGVPILDEGATSTGHSNFNALAYFKVHDQYARDAKQVLRHRPIALLRSLESAWFCYFRPASDLPYYFEAEAAPIGRWERVFSAVFYGQLRRTSRHDEIRAYFYSGRLFSALSYTGLWLLILLPVLTGWGLLQFSPERRKRWTRERLVVIGYVMVTIIVPTFTVNLLAFQENNRYRFPLDPFFLLLLGMMSTRLCRALPVNSAAGPAGKDGLVS